MSRKMDSTGEQNGDGGLPTQEGTQEGIHMYVWGYIDLVVRGRHDPATVRFCPFNFGRGMRYTPKFQFRDVTQTVL